MQDGPTPFKIDPDPNRPLASWVLHVFMHGQAVSFPIYFSTPVIIRAQLHV